MKELFNQSFSRLKTTIDKEEFQIWLEDLQFSHSENNVLFVNTNSEFKKETIEDQYLGRFNSILREISGQDLQIRLQMMTGDNPEVSKRLTHQENFADKSTEPNESQTQEFPNLDTSGVDVKLNFSTFIEAGFNRVALGFSQKATEKIGVINPLYIYGNVGVGKTHLMHSIGNYYRQNFSFLKVKYFNSHEFVEEYTRALKENRDRQFRLKYFSMDVLLFDDIQFFMGKKQSSIQLFQIFNHIHQHGKQMVFCSDQLPEDLIDLDMRLKSRLAGSHIVQIEDMKESDKEIILKAFCQRNQVQLEPGVHRFLLERLPCDIRQIQAIVNTLTAYRDIYREELTIDFCKKNIKQLVRHQPLENLTPEKILLTLTNISGVSVNELKSSKRTKNIAYCRQLLMYLLREYAHLSLPEIGRFLGGKTNSAILNGVSRISERLKKDLATKTMMDNILAEF